MNANTIQKLQREASHLAMEEPTNKVVNRLVSIVSDLFLNSLVGKPTLTFKEACAYTGYGDRMMRKLVSEHKVSYSKPNGKLFFNREDLDAYMMSNRLPSEQEIDEAASSYLNS